MRVVTFEAAHSRAERRGESPEQRLGCPRLPSGAAVPVASKEVPF